MREYINPNELIYTEEMQNRLANITHDIVEFNPVVCVSTEEGLKIIDGHNRSEYAKQNNIEVPFVSIEEEKYNKLVELGYDNMEIAYAILVENNEDEAAKCINWQFPGANIMVRGEEAYREI